MAIELTITMGERLAAAPRSWTVLPPECGHPGDLWTCQACHVINCARRTTCLWCDAIPERRAA